MSDLANVFNSINKLVESKQKEDELEYQKELRIYETKLNVDADLLLKQIDMKNRELLSLKGDFETKNDAYYDVSGDLVKVSDYDKTDSALVVLDQIKNPLSFVSP